MAENTQNPGAVTNSFTKGMVKDFNDTFVGDGLWTHARNAVNNSHDGQVGVLGNEPANLKCVQLPYTLIGAILLRDDQWVIFTTDDTNCEIGVFDESRCFYQKKVNSPCLGFKKSNLINGVARQRFGCEDLVYWDDGLNPSRLLNLNEIPYKTIKSYDKQNRDCIIETPTTELDCEQLRLAPLLKTPCIDLKKGRSAGTLPNGSYQVAVAYSINEIRVADYFTPSDVQSLFDHLNLSGSLEVSITNLDPNFDEYELVVIYFANAVQTVKRLGFYSTNQTRVKIDTVDPRLEEVPFSLIPLKSQIYDKSDAMYSVNNYLMRVGMYGKYDFNYQPIANKIKTKWVAVQYPADYYQKGGSNAGYMRDEQYAFFIRWIYNTGDKSASYHIPGREARNDETSIFANINTAGITSLTQTVMADGGTVIAEGEMGYWESTERYIDNKPEVWGELCGKPIRHHKFPDQTVNPLLNHYNSKGQNIVVLGVKFDNILTPVDNNGNPIESIVGYEILRGSREGQKTIVAKGQLNNMREFDVPDRPNIKGLFQNYPYNDLRPDYYLTTNRSLFTKGSYNDTSVDPQERYRKDIFSFHSPETTFSKPFLSVSQLKVYQLQTGKSLGYFENPYKHPKAKVIGQGIDFIQKILKVVTFINNLNVKSGDTLPPVTTAATKDVPFTVMITPTMPEYKQTTVGNILRGIGSAFGPIGSAIGGVAGGIVDGVGYGLKLTNYYLMAGIVAFVCTEATHSQLTQLLIGLIPRKQYAAQYNSHGFYYDSLPYDQVDAVKTIKSSYYMDQNVQTFGSEFVINNLYRNTGVVLQIDGILNDSTTVIDNSRNTMTGFRALTGSNVEMNQIIESDISSLYGALKTPLDSQYGQLHSILQMPTFSCIQYTTPSKTVKYTSDIIFGGDTYINRFTEKNPFFYFNDWMVNMDDESEYNYREGYNVPYPRYWLDSTQVHYKMLDKASNYHRLNDGNPPDEGFFYQKPGFFYLFCNGVRDFFVESEVNLAQRDWGENPGQRHYDAGTFTDLSTLFRSDVIKDSNYYKYDYSLSTTKLYNNFTPWSFLLPLDYSPLMYETCFTKFPYRVTYSLQQTSENKKDNWRIFLTNNYRDFSDRITSIKNIGKTGAIFMMEQDSPMQFVGVDTFQTDAGTKVYIGDGGLLNPSTPMQNVVNADRSYQYGSCQNKYSVIATPQGVFWASQNQGKVFQFGGQLDEISRNGMKWWFAKHLPSELLKVYPDYPYYDNPVNGIGVQMTYDNTNEMIYISKKDYKPKRKDLYYDGKGFYYVKGSTQEKVCRKGWTYNGTVCVKNGSNCPPGYTLQNGTCVRVFTADADQTGVITKVSRTPYDVYGSLGTRVYNTSSTSGGYTALSTSNPFWIRTASPGNWSSLTNDQKQALDLDDTRNGPVNRLAIWGQNIVNGVELNNYNHSGSNLTPVSTWIGFDVCINIAQTKVYHVAIAGDNRYRLLLDGVLILEDQTGVTATFNYLHIYPVTITAGSHILRLEGYNDSQKAGFGCEVYDLSNRPSGQSVVDFLNAQTNYNNLQYVFTTRNVTEFNSNLYTCPTGFTLNNPTCNQPVCTKTVTAPFTIETEPATTITVQEKVYCDFTDEKYWEDASWTISYDPKGKSFISFHDWKPTFLLPSKNHFMSVNYDSIWKHNSRCDLFCNFYDKDYPFDIEFVTSTGQSVSTIRSVEYIMEAYKFHNDCSDKFHVLDEGFDQAMIYNSEQVSGLLKLNLKSKINPLDLLSYPQIDTESINIQYSKEENKYRFNEFWDITKNRGEFDSTVNIPMMITGANGVDFRVNPDYVNYAKDPLQHKRFRHHSNKVWLRRVTSNGLKIIVKLSNQKITPSYR